MTGIENNRDFALGTQWVEEAGRDIMRRFVDGFSIESKGDGTPVTEADIAAEKLLRERIETAFPEDGLVGEEFGEKRGSSGRRWFLDPIDGTRSFARKVPLFGVLLALEEDGAITFGAIHLPALKQTVAAARGQGCYDNGTRCSVSSVDTLERAVVLTSDVEHIDEHGYRDSWDRIRKVVDYTRTWGDAFGYVQVATGKAEAMFDPIVAPWDVAPMRVIVEEAGGVMTSAEGDVADFPPSVLATNRALSTIIRETWSP